MRKPNDKDSDIYGLLDDQGKPVPLMDVACVGRLQGVALDMTILQRFRNAESRSIEAVYVFPLPTDVAVHGLRITVGDREIHARIEDRKKAITQYEAALAQGHEAFRLDQERPNVFRLLVGNLAPGEEARVELTLVATAQMVARGIRLAIPTTISPRYFPPDLLPAEQAAAERISPPLDIATPYGLEIRIEARMASPITAVESPSHTIRVEVCDRTAIVTLAHRKTALDRDFVLLFETAEPRSASAQVTRYLEHDHILVELYPDLPMPPNPLPRNIIFLVDSSGSMSGDSIREARFAVELCLRALREGDRFQIVRFGSSIIPLSPGPLLATQTTVDEAVQKVRRMRADLDGTELLAALQWVLDNRCDRFDLFILTDSEVANEAQILLYVRNHPVRPRIFSFGIGAGCNEFLVVGLARETGGLAEFIFPGERIEPKVLRQFSRLDTPWLEDVDMNWGGMKVEMAPAGRLALFAGDAVILTARARHGEHVPEGREVALSGHLGGRRWEWKAMIKRAEAGSAVPYLWARNRIRDLEIGFGTSCGKDEQVNLSRRRTKLKGVSIQYGMLSSVVSFIAVEERLESELPRKKRSKTIRNTRPVPVMLTVGWHGLGSIDALAHRQDPTCPATFPEVPAFLRRREAPAPTTSSPSPVAAGNGPMAFWYGELLAGQRVEGTFPLSPALARLAQIDHSQLQEWARRTIARGGSEEEILATTLTLLLLEKRAADRQDEWRAAATKAREWLACHPAQIEGIDLSGWLINHLLVLPD